MIKYNGIGRLFAEEWQEALNNIGVFYTPVPTDLMTLPELQSIATTLQGLIDYWQNQVYSNTSSEAIANAQAITDLEQSKLNTVNEIIFRKSMTTTTPTNTTTDPLATEPVEPEQKSWLPIILIGAAALYFFTRKKKRA